MTLENCPFCGNPIHDKGYEGRGNYITKLELFCPQCRVDITLDTDFFVEERVAIDGTRVIIGSDCVTIWNKRADK